MSRSSIHVARRISNGQFFTADSRGPAPHRGAGLWSWSLAVEVGDFPRLTRVCSQCGCATSTLRARRSSGGSNRRRRLARSSTRTGSARTAGPAGLYRPRSAGTTRSALVEHGGVVSVVVPVMTMAGDPEAGEEDGRDDEQDARHDHHPCRQSVEPIRFDRLSGWRGGDSGRPGWGFRCFSHTSNNARASNSRT